jgi:hypothetical protein
MQTEPPTSGSRFVRGVALALLAMVAALTVAALTPPAALGSDAPSDAFSAARAIASERDVLRAPRPVGSPESAATAARLVERLKALGLEVDVQESMACGHALEWWRCARVRNVVARLRGSANDHSAVALFAHYDTVPSSPGAADDGAGVATLLETARALRASPPLAHDVLFVIDDGEEPALLGAIAFVRENPWRGDVRAALNFEARGSSGPSAMFDSSAGSGALVRAFAGSVPRPTSNSLTSTLSRALPNDTDGSVFKASGVPMLNFAFIDGFENYHRATDGFDALDPRSVQHHGSHALATTRSLANGDLDHLGDVGLVWFDVFSRWLVVYPPWVGSVLTALTLGLFAAAFVRARQASTASVRGVLRVFGHACLAVVASAAGSLVLAWLLGLGARWTVLVAHGGAVVLPHLALTVAVVVGALGRARRSATSKDVVLGALVLPVTGAAVTAVLAPGAGFLFHVPAVCLAADALLGTLRVRASTRVIGATVLALPAVHLFTNLAYSALLMAGGASPTLCVVCSAILLTMIWGVLSLALDPAALPWAARGSLVTAAGLALVAVAIVHADSRTPRGDSVVYALDADRHAARWVSYDAAPDAYTGRFLGPSPRVEAMPDVDPWAWPDLSADAPAVDLIPPELVVREDRVDAGTRHLTLRVRSARGARCFTVFDAAGAAITGTHVDGRQPMTFVHTTSVSMDQRLWYLLSGTPPRQPWNVEICGTGDEGADIRFDVAPGARLDLRAVDRSDGLPSVAPPGPRPPGFMPSLLGDATLVAKRYDLSAPAAQ